MQENSDFRVESYATTLDLFSTSPTRACALPVSLSLRCAYGAPFFAFQKDGRRYGVVQGSCNHWDCPRCGKMVAKQHYGRIVEGCRTIAQEHQLYFLTLTCRGADLSVDEAEQNYLKWTSKFIDAAYTKTKREKGAWFYVQVTEKQKRGHPHSHILTTFAPDDIRQGYVTKWQRDNAGVLISKQVPALRSEWIHAQCVRAGLGDQYDISIVKTVEAASRYVAKYMFKESQFTANFPPRWKRVRYSQSFPKLPEQKTDAFVLLSSADWRLLASKAAVVDVQTGEAYETAAHFLAHDDIILNERRDGNGVEEQLFIPTAFSNV